MCKVTFLRGLPGSGKSEWAEQIEKRNPNSTVVLSFDELLHEYDPASYDADYSTAFHKNYREVTNLLHSRLFALVTLGGGEHIIVDNLNLDFEQVCQLAKACDLAGAYELELVNFFITVEDSVRRQQRRKAHTVPEERVRQMDEALRKIYACQFDGKVINLRFDTQEVIVAGNEYHQNDDKEYSVSAVASFNPSKSLLI